MGMVIGFTKVEEDINSKRNRIKPIVEITQMLILEFE
jgi:hypothetical protein